MAGKPWEQYQTTQPAAQPEGPWSQFQPTQEPERGVMQRVGDWLTGARREESIPLAPWTAALPSWLASPQANLNLPADKAAELTALLATTASDDRLKSGIQRIIPDAQFETDQFGNLVVIAPVGGVADERAQWTRFYPNPQGLDVTDIMQGAGVATLAGPMGRIASGLGLTGLLGGAAIGGTEAALIEGASSKLSGSDFKISDIPYGMAGGVAGAKLGEIVGRLMQSKNVGQIFDVTGALTPQARAALREAGIEEGAVTPDLAQAISDYAARGVDPQQAGRSAMAETLPVPVPLSRGQVSGTPVQQLFETEAGKGVYGEAPMRLMQDLERRQQEALRANIPAMQERLGAPAIERGTGGAMAQEALVGQREAARQEAGRLFDVAREAGPAAIPSQVAGWVDDTLAASIRDFPPAVRPVTTSLYDQINQVLSSGGDIKSLFDIRSQLVKAGNAGTQEAAAAAALKGELDRQLIGLADQALLSGDRAIIDAYGEAIKNYADFAGMWKSRGILDQLTQTVRRDGEMTLRVAPEDAANYILGANASGMITKANLVRNLRTLKDQLPEAEWNGIRQEAFMRIFDTAQRGQNVSGQTFSSLWSRFQRENPALVRELFTESDQALFSQFAAVATTVSNTARNTSNSATTLMGLLPKMAQAFGTSNIGRLVSIMPFAPLIKERLGSMRIGSALRGVPTASTQAQQMIGAGIGGGAATSDVINDPVTQQIGRTTGIQLP